MKTITLYVVLQYLRRYGFLWTLSFLWQYAGRAGVLEFTVPGYGQWKFYARRESSDVRVFHQVVLRRSYQLPIVLPAVRFIVDAGANAGYAALYFAQANPDARILAIEPDRSNFEMLCTNSENVARIECFLGALWPVETRLSIQNPSAPKTAIMVGEAENCEGDVPTITIPRIVATHGFIDILKLDIEGAEIELFSHCDLSWLDEVGCLIIELHDFMRPGCSMAFYRAIARRSFQQHISGENLIIVFDHARKPSGAASV